MLLLLGKKKDMDKFKASMRKFIRIMMGLGFNVKNTMVDLLVDVNREGIWMKRLIKINNDWKEMANFQWAKLDNICNKLLIPNNREISQKNLDSQTQDMLIEIQNKFNRAFCNEHKKKRLSTSHLSEFHDVNIDYEKIENLIRSKNLPELKKFLLLLRDLECKKMDCILENSGNVF